MHYRFTACSLAVAAAFASGSVFAAPTVSWKQPSNGRNVSGTISGSACEVTGSNIRQVRFYVDNKWVSTDTSSRWNCSIDTRKYSNGTHYLRAIAYDSRGSTRSSVVRINVQNGTASTPTPTPTPTTGPTIAFTAPAEGGTLSGNVQGPPNCIVTGNNIARVMFYLNNQWTNTDGNLSNGLGCWIDTTKYANGSYTVKAVAYDSAGKTATATRTIKIQNGTSSSSGAPTVAFTAPAAGATLSGDVSCTATASDTGGSIAKVDFLLDNKNIGSDTAAPYNCAFNSLSLANGTHVLTAIATDNSGQKSSVQRSFTVKNDSTTPDDPVPTGSISAADIVHQAQAEVPFAQQSGYNTQVIGKYLSANQIPESGIHGSTLSNGETLRLGKHVDPRDSSRKALAFQLAPNDPVTSGSHRAEIRFPAVIDMNKTYWAAFSVYAYDWGSLASNDSAMFAMQLHAGAYGASLSPSISVLTGKGGRNFWIDARTSTSSSPTQSTSYSVRSAERPIPFGRWMDIVVKFKLNSPGNGFVQVWADGTQIFNHVGPVGYQTGSDKPYFKFGYYNWSSFNSTRKVLLRSPVVVADPTGSKYTPEQLRQFVQSR